MKKETLIDLIDWLLHIPINMDNNFLSPRFGKNGNDDEFSSLNGVKEIIMVLLTLNEKMTMSQLADYIGSSNQRMTFPVNRLVEDGLAERTRDPDDNRIFFIAASEKGRAITQDYLKAVYEKLRTTFSEKLTDEEFDRFAELLEINMKYMKELADNVKTDYGKNN